LHEKANQDLVSAVVVAEASETASEDAARLELAELVLDERRLTFATQHASARKLYKGSRRM